MPKSRGISGLEMTENNVTYQTLTVGDHIQRGDQYRSKTGGDWCYWHHTIGLPISEADLEGIDCRRPILSTATDHTGVWVSYKCKYVNDGYRGKSTAYFYDVKAHATELEAYRASFNSIVKFLKVGESL
jgi:hypothetical protein